MMIKGNQCLNFIVGEMTYFFGPVLLNPSNANAIDNNPVKVAVEDAEYLL